MKTNEMQNVDAAQVDAATNVGATKRAPCGLMGLEVFHVAVELCDAIYRLGLKGNMRDQLTRASESVVLNISEAHPAKGLDRARRFQNALNELSEMRGALTILRLRRIVSSAKHDELWTLVDRTGAMLYRLIHPRR